MGINYWICNYHRADKSYILFVGREVTGKHLILWRPPRWQIKTVKNFTIKNCKWRPKSQNRPNWVWIGLDWFTCYYDQFRSESALTRASKICLMFVELFHIQYRYSTIVLLYKHIVQVYSYLRVHLNFLQAFVRVHSILLRKPKCVRVIVLPIYLKLRFRYHPAYAKERFLHRIDVVTFGPHV